MAHDANRPNWLQRLTAPLRRTGTVREIIGRYVVAAAQINLFRSRARVKSIDETIPDYEFYDKLRRGKAKGYHLGGLFARRIERVLASWIMGAGVNVTLADAEASSEERVTYTNAQLSEFVAGLLDAGQAGEDENDPDRDERTQSLLMHALTDSLGLGDQWIIVNADGSLSVPSPDTVYPTYDDLDYRRLLAVTIRTKLGGYSIEDTYAADGRTITVYEGGAVTSVTEFDNLIGRIPIVHIATDRGNNETYGHPVHESLLPLYDQYDDLLYKQLDGAKLLGNPIPTFFGMEDVDEVINANDPAEAETYTDRDGNTVTRTQLNIDENAVLVIGKGGDFKFAAPPVGFTEDTKTALKSLFLLLLDHTGIPEFIWGNEVSSGRSSSDTQMEQFARDIQARQRDAGGWIVRLCRIWLQMRALTDPQIVVDSLALTWPKLLGEDETLRLRAIELAREVLRDETYLELLDLVEKPADEVKAAAKEWEEKRAAMFPDGDTAAFRGNLESAEGESDE